MPSKICVIIPAFNASGTIKDVVNGALKHIPKVIVADDGSVDGTAAAASEAGAEVISIGKNMGKGNALKRLFSKAVEEGYDAVISMDADGQHDPSEIPLFISAHITNPDDVIVGSRMHEKEKIPRARYNSMHIARFYISFAANQFLEDTQCGFRLYPLDLIKKMRLTTERYAVETEILIKTGNSGAKVRFVDIKTIYGNNGSHFRPVADVANITAYVIAYLHIKWLMEGLTPNKPDTYSLKCSLRDMMCSNILFQALTTLTALPASLFFLLEYILLKPFIPNNFASVRKLQRGFARITVATHMLPVVLLVSTFEMLMNMTGLKLNLLDGFIKGLFPNLWEGEKG